MPPDREQGGQGIFSSCFLIKEEEMRHPEVLIGIAPETDQRPECSIFLVCPLPRIVIKRPDMEKIFSRLLTVNIVGREKRQGAECKQRFGIALMIVNRNQPGSLLFSFLHPAEDREKDILLGKVGMCISGIHENRTQDEAFCIPVSFFMDPIQG